MASDPVADFLALPAEERVTTGAGEAGGFVSRTEVGALAAAIMTATTRLANCLISTDAMKVRSVTDSFVHEMKRAVDALVQLEKVALLIENPDQIVSSGEDSVGDPG